MKIEQLLVQYFYLNKKVTLQGIGTFNLSPDFIVPPDTDKDIVIPENAVSFKYNSRATEDEGLIDYIVQQTRKIKPLASADLESYVKLASQFLNIGKPLKIDGIGMLEKNQTGEYAFIQGHLINTKTEQAEVKLKEKNAEDIYFGNEATPASVNNKKLLALLAGVVLLVAIGAASWYFFIKQDETLPAAENTTEQNILPALPITDTTKKDSLVTIRQKTDSVVLLATPPTNNGYTFKVVIKNYPSLRLAQQSFTRLSNYGHKLLLYTADSVIYKVAMPFTRPLADTTYAKDSIRNRLFGGKPYIELK